MKIAIMELDKEGIKDTLIEVVIKGDSINFLSDYMKENGFKVISPFGGAFFNHNDGRVRYGNFISTENNIDLESPMLKNYKEYLDQLDYDLMFPK